MFYFRKNKIHAIKHDLTAGKKKPFCTSRMGNLPQKRDFYPRKGKLCLTKEHFTPQKGGFFLRERVFYITKVDFSLRKSNFYLRKKQFPPQEGEGLYIRKWKFYLSH